MPAISPARLQDDVTRLFTHADEPARFESMLEGLFEFYADRTIRPAQVGKPAVLMPAYHVPKPVLRALEGGLADLARRSPVTALELADRFWMRDRWEYKLLAVRLLGMLPDGFAGETAARIEAWLESRPEEELAGQLFLVAAQTDWDAALELIERRLTTPVGAVRTVGLAGLTVLAGQAEETALPGVYRLFALLLEEADSQERSRKLVLARTLAKRSPAETAYFLRQQYLVARTPETGRLLRQCLPLFPEEIREELRRVIRTGS